MPQMQGQYTDGPNKGRRWEVYAEPGTATGYTRKEWDPADTSVDGGPQYYYSPFNYSAAQVDEQQGQQRAADAAARAAQQSAADQADDAKSAAFWQGVQQQNERGYQENVRQFNAQQGTRDRDVDVRERLGDADNRTRLQLGLAELEQRDRENGTKDARDRDANTITYLSTLGKLRLPMSELIALSQRAVAGVAGSGVATGATGSAPGSGLTPDQWQALAQGVARDYEQGQIGQGSALAG